VRRVLAILQELTDRALARVYPERLEKVEIGGQAGYVADCRILS
jgi:hypothetical protein